MALLDKIFATKRKLDDANRQSRDRGRCSKINPSQVRLLLFKECDWRGRKLLFDSSTIERVVANKNDVPAAKATEVPCIVEVSERYSYVYNGPAADAGALGEMIFGAVAMSQKGVSFKIHIMEEPRRLMCTKVFLVPSRRELRPERKASSSQSDCQGGQKPLRVPSEEVALSLSFDRADSGFCGEQSRSSASSSSLLWDDSALEDDLFAFNATATTTSLTASSAGSWGRRASRDRATRFEIGGSDDQMSGVSPASSAAGSVSSGGSPRRSRLGLALLVTLHDSDLEVIRRLVEHSTALQALARRLRAAAAAAGAQGARFVATMHKAHADAAIWLSCLVRGAGAGAGGGGAWLRAARGERGERPAEALLRDLCAVLGEADTKHTNFFFSTLLTQVLTHHLGWVATVSPYEAAGAGAAAGAASALWAQLGDLSGGGGLPPRPARTIISSSKNTQFLNRLLLVLTYFLRCGEVKRTDYPFKTCDDIQTKVIQVKSECSLKRTASKVNNLSRTLVVPEIRTPDSSETLVPCDSNMNLIEMEASSKSDENHNLLEQPMTSQLRRNPTMAISLKSDSNSSLNSSTSEELDQSSKVLFVLGDDEKLVGLKNKSIGGKSVKKSKQDDKVTKKSDGTKDSEGADCKTELVGKGGEVIEVKESKGKCDEDTYRKEGVTKSGASGSPGRCCETQHSKPIKHSGFKFEFEKYPQIVTNYMKSKNLEILDRHYIGKPGNLKLDNFQFDPTMVPPIQEERCEACYKCKQMESLLQTPTNASELEFMNDMPRLAEPQIAKTTVEPDSFVTPKTFVHKRKPNTILVNVTKPDEEERDRIPKEKDSSVRVKEKVMFPMPKMEHCKCEKSGFDETLLGGVNEHYVPDLVLQGCVAGSASWEGSLRRDLALAAPAQPLAVLGDLDAWEVRVVGRGGGGGGGGGGGMSALVGAMLDALPHMWRARVPAPQCLSYLESKLREFCVLSKTLAELLMSTDFCDMETLTKSLAVDVNDVPLLLAVAATHTPQVARRYGISYR